MRGNVDEADVPFLQLVVLQTLDSHVLVPLGARESAGTGGVDVEQVFPHHLPQRVLHSDLVD